MTIVNRRLALVGLGVASAALVSGALPAHSQTTDTQTTTLAKGVRQVVYGEGPSIIPGYKTVRLRDVVVDPGAKLDPGQCTR
jgi:hypothetical protein